MALIVKQKQAFTISG